MNKRLKIATITGIILSVWILSEMLGFIRLTYPLIIKREFTLKNPVKVARITSEFIILEDGRTLDFGRPTADLDVTLRNSNFQVDLEPLGDPSVDGYFVYANMSRGLCGTAWAGLVRIPLIPIPISLRALRGKIGQAWLQECKEDATTPRQLTLNRMKAIVIDNVEYRQANLSDVLDYIEKSSRESASHAEHTVGLGLCLSGSTNLQPKVQGNPLAAGTRSEPKDVEITFSARHISLYSLMNIVCKISDLKWFIDEKGLIKIKAKDAAEGGANDVDNE